MLSQLPRRWSCAACVLLLVSAVDARSQTLMFAGDDIPSEPGARAIASADFDRNGWPDVAHANVTRSTVSIVLNHPAGGLAHAFEIPVPAGPFDMTAGDFNRDDIPDLAVACADASAISLLLGKGDGTFTRFDIAAPGQNPRGITSGDVNNDGKPDLIYTAWSTRSVQVLLGDGAGGFTRGVTYAGSPANPQGVATADFNHDGRLDVAVVYAGGGGLRILYGNGGTAFSARAIAGSANLNVVATGDFNADGWTDVAAASTATSLVSIYLGSASGLAQAGTYQTGTSPRGIRVADVNQDGALDVLTANRGSSTVTVLLGDRAHPGRFVSGLELGAGSGSRALAANDFNADGRVDIVTGNEFANSITLLSNDTVFRRAAFSFTRRTLAPPGDHFSQFGMRVLTADFNRDGRMDVAMFRTLIDDEPARLSVVLTGGATIDLPAIGFPTAFAIADVNADGNADIIYSASSPDGDIVSTFLGNGRGGFRASPPSTSGVTGLAGMVVGDLNRDSRADVVVFTPDFGDASSVVLPMIGQGDGTFTAGKAVSGRAPTVPILVDVNRHAKLDLAGLDNGQLRVWAGDGSGGLAASSAVMAAPESVEHFKIADVNADGYVDAVFVGGLGVDVALGSATGFELPVHTSSFQLCGPSFGDSCWVSPDVFVLADIDLDGKLDIITAGGDIAHGRGDGAFGPAESFDVDGVDLAVTDFTGDGLPDVVYITSFGKVAVLVNERRSVNRPPTVTAGPDRTLDYQDLLFTDGGTPCFAITAAGTDPDLHRLSYVWRNSAGAVVGQAAVYDLSAHPGTYPLSVTVADNRGGTASDTVVITIAPAKEIVLHFSQSVEFQGDWSAVADTTAADGVRAYSVNRGAPKVSAPIPFPESVVVVSFVPDPTQVYKLWIRLEADGNSWANDSIWIQFSDSTDVAGTPKYRTGTTSGLPVNLEECSNCGVSGWGWEDDGWGASNKNGVLLRFPDGGPQTLWIQTREDGVSVDQIVLSAEKYLTARPGAAKNDHTILPQTFPRK